MEEKVTIMVLKVDLQCYRCYKKVKKVLCNFPQIREQKYDEKANTVTITVVSCCPEKIRDKICCKGGRSIKSITIKPPTTPPSSTPTTTSKPPSSTPTTTSKPPSSTPTTTSKPPSSTPTKTSKPPPAPPCRTAPLPIGFCCVGCFHGHVWGPCYFGGPPPRPRPCPCYETYCCCGGGYKYYNVSRGDCLCEENPQACTIM